MIGVVEAKGIKSTSFFSNSSDSYCSITVKTDCEKGARYTVLQTSVQKKTLNPRWNENFEFSVSPDPENDVIFLSMIAKQVVASDKIIGRVEIPISILATKPNEIFDCWYKLLETKGNLDLRTPGKIRLVLKFLPRSSDAPSAPGEEYHPIASATTVVSSQKPRSFSEPDIHRPIFEDPSRRPVEIYSHQPFPDQEPPQNNPNTHPQFQNTNQIPQFQNSNQIPQFQNSNQIPSAPDNRSNFQLQNSPGVPSQGQVQLYQPGHNPEPALYPDLPQQAPLQYWPARYEHSK